MKMHVCENNKEPEFSANYSDVKACLESFPYDREIAESTIETIKKTFQGFFVYLSKAKEEPQQGYSFRAVDLIKELDALLLKNYTLEYQFMSKVKSLIDELKDVHTEFYPLCYMTAFDYNNSHIDCEVTHIDGRPSMEVIKEFADTVINLSKDAGVRFNEALVALKNNNNGDRIISASIFTSRIGYSLLPEKSSIEYTLVCANDVKTKFVREWKIGSLYYDRFNTSEDFRNEFCQEIPTILSDEISKMYEPKIYNQPMSDVELVHVTIMASFYILSDNKTGVVVIPTVMTPEDEIVNEMFELQIGFDLLEDRGVTKIILDFHENGGGIIELALFFVYLLFPDSSPDFDNDMVVSELSRAALEAASSQPNAEQVRGELTMPPLDLGAKDLIRWAAKTVRSIFSTSYFNIYGYKDPNTENHFRTVEEFIGNHTYIRGGTPTSFTSKFIDRDIQEFSLFVKLLSGNINEYKWKSEDIIILTNGLCGSSCSLITHRMAEKFNVSTIAVGGFKDTPLSYASFPGSQVLDLDQIRDELTFNGLLQNETLKDLIPQPFLFPAILRFTFKEIYDIVNKDNILEYTYKPAKHRLYYDEKSARDPSRLWLEAVKANQNVATN
ncbi:1786_t:CDS:2 [Funneliformis caledonium]|uniref:1786_t:CDS:1 n=1 Tax=Funneliformis caledonium TaxID=1117310 RepID=A0A9N9B821_9GLOM|nr:1786_t:CDS:2 [Funneliformis caledonium]